MGTHPIFESDFDCLTDEIVMRITFSRIIFAGIVILFNFTVLWSLRCPDERQHTAKHHRTPKHHQDSVKTEAKVVENLPANNDGSNDATSNGHKLAIVIPFRDRFDELLEFAPAIDAFLTDAGINHEIFVINQADKYRFNRASLINVGFIYTQKLGFDYFAMHDVDLIPTTHQVKYDYPTNGPVHLASPDLHPMYHYANYVGGILLLTHADFKRCRGMANKFWGWGREDDEFFMRMKDQKLTVNRPQGVTTGYDTYRHVHDKERRKRDYKRIGDQKKDQFTRDKEGGYDNVEYEQVRVDQIKIGAADVTVVNVELKCNKEKTPWCEG